MVALTISNEERELSRQSMKAFAEYAHVDSTADLSSFPDIRRLQIEHHRWQASKLDERADCSLAVLSLGIVEEACYELLVSIDADSQEEVFDSLGDIIVFSCGVCTDLRLDLMTLARDFDASELQEPKQGLDSIFGLFKAIGMLAHVVVHHRQFRRGYDDIEKVRIDAGAAIARICTSVHWLAFSNGWDASVLFQEVITNMMEKRDWSKNSFDGETK